MQKKLKHIATLALATLAISHGMSAIAQTTSIRLGHGISEDHPLGQGSLKFADILKRLSNGKMGMKVFPATQLGSENQMIGAVRGGQLEMTIVASAPLGTLMKEYQLFDLPFLFQNEKEVDAVLDGALGQRLLDLAQEKNMVGLCYWENGFRQVTNSRRAVAKMEDLAGLKIRTMQNPVYLETFKTLGANAVPLNFSELFSAMENKAVDAQENPISIIYSSKFFEVQKHLSLTKHAYAPYVVLVGKNFWDKLSVPERDVMRKGCFEARDFQRSLSRRMAAQQLDQLKANGMTVTDITPAESARLRARLKPVVDRFTQDIGPAIVEQAQREIAAVRGQ